MTGGAPPPGTVATIPCLIGYVASVEARIELPTTREMIGVISENSQLSWTLTSWPIAVPVGNCGSGSTAGSVQLISRASFRTIDW